MKTIVINHLRSGKTRKYGLLRKTTICDYETNQGLVREKCREGRLPEYRLRETREIVNVEFV